MAENEAEKLVKRQNRHLRIAMLKPLIEQFSHEK